MLGKKIKVQKKFWSSKILITKNLYPKSFVKIRSVTAEIFLIWTNVARTNVAWTNVTTIVEICSK